MRIHNNRWIILASLAVIGANAQPSHGQEFTWTGAVSQFWPTAGNWSPSGPPTGPSQFAAFVGPLPFNLPNINTNVSVGGLIFRPGAASHNYTITGNANNSLTLTGSTSILVDPSGSGSPVQTINLNNNSGALLVPGGTPLTIVNNTFDSSNPTLVLGANTALNEVSGTSGLVVAGSGHTRINGTNDLGGGFTKRGLGTLRITGNWVSASGGSRLAGGQVILDYSANALNRIPAGTLNLDGVQLNLTNFGSTNSFTESPAANTILNPGHSTITVSAASGTTLGISLGALSTTGGALHAVPGSGFVRTSNSLTNGIIGGYVTTNLGSSVRWAAKDGSNNVVPLTTFGVNSYSPGVNTSVTVANAPSNVTTNSLMFDASLTSPFTWGPGDITLQSGGILITPGVFGSLSIGSSANVLRTSGSTPIYVHQYGDATANIGASLSSSGGLVKTGPRPLILSGLGGVSGPIHVNQGDLTVTNLGSVNSSSGIFLNHRVDEFPNDPTFTVALGNGVNGTISRPIQLGADTGMVTRFSTGTSANSRVTLNGVISSATGATTDLNFVATSSSGSGFNLTGVNTFTGTVRLFATSLGINSTSNLGNSANELILSNNSSTAGGLELLANATLNRPVTVSNTSRIVVDGSVSGTISGLLSGAGALHKDGLGTLTLSGSANTHTGGLFVEAGRLQFSDATHLGPVSNNLTINAGATLNLVSGVNSTGTGRQLFVGPTIGGGIATINVPAGAELTIPGIIASRSGGSGGLEKTGAGTLTLSGANAYSGGTFIRQGLLQANANTALGNAAGPVTIDPLGTLRFTGNTVTGRAISLFNGTLEAASGTIVALNGATVGGGFLRGPGSYSLTGNTSLTGVTTFNSTTMNVTGTASASNFSNNGTLTVNSGQTFGMNFATHGAAGLMTINGTTNVRDFTSYGRMQLNPGGTVNNLAGTLVYGGGSVTNIGIYNPANQQVTPGGMLNIGAADMRVQGGFVRNNGTITGTGNLIIDFGAMVRGAGEIDLPNAPIRLNGGQLVAGNSPGLARISNFSLVSTGTTGGDFSNATGIAGPPIGSTGTQLSGWSVFEYGNAANTGGSAIVEGTPAARAIWQFRTVIDGGDYSTPGVPANFNHAQAYTWQIVRPRSAADVGNPTNTTPTNTVAQVSIFDTATMQTVPLNDANLNAYLRFDDTAWNWGTVPVNERGTFAFTLQADGLGAANRVIALTYSPVPEPAEILALSFGGLMVVGAVRRWRRPAPRAV